MQGVRDKLLYIMILILVAMAAFQGGYILGHHRNDELKATVQKLKEWVIDHGGRIAALENLGRKKVGSKE